MTYYNITRLFEAVPYLKQNEIAERAGISPQLLSAIVKGRKKLTPDVEKAVNKALSSLSTELRHIRIKP